MEGDTMQGKFIVIEGCDSSGKETQSKLLETRLKEKGYKCLRFSFPMYETPTGKIIKESYLNKNGKGVFPEGAANVDPYIAALYYAADRKYNIKKILEYYNEGYYIILDRYITSNMAYQGSKILDKDERFYMYQWIDKLEYWLLKLPKPDKTILLDLPLEYTKELEKNKETIDDIERDKEYLQRSIDSYKELSELYGWNIVNCIKDGKIKKVEEINDEIIKIILDEKY